VVDQWDGLRMPRQLSLDADTSWHTPWAAMGQGTGAAASHLPRTSKIGVYLVHLITRNSFGLMTRKLSVTESRRSAQFRGTGLTIPETLLATADEVIQ
jgi:hypothetical protein